MFTGLGADLRRLEAEGRPIGISLIGAGQMGTDIVSQVSRMAGLRVVAVADRLVERAVEAYRIAGGPGPEPVICTNAAAAGAALAAGQSVAAADFESVIDHPQVDVVIDATGVPNVAVRSALLAMSRGKHVVMMSVEADITAGPILKWYADRQGAIYTLAAGDEPAAIMELHEFCETLGLQVVAAGKGKNNPLDRNAVPDQWAAEAQRRGLTPEMLVEFVDGSKTQIEMAAVANATGLVPDVRGMHGPRTTLPELKEAFAAAEQGGILSRTGVVDYAIGAISPGVFVIATTDHPRLRECLVLRDMGHGPNYLFFRPFHLCSMEVPISVALAAIHRRASMVPGRRLVAEVMATAKTDLAPGRTLDRIGGYCYYGMIDHRAVARELRALPLGLAQGAVLRRPVPKGQVITLDDVDMPDSTLYRLRRLQDRDEDGAMDAEALAAAVAALVPEIE